jgi:CubicO group peptidase (beta-lactamase class C family)
LIEIHGTCAPGFNHVRDSFARNFEVNESWEVPDLGACVSATIEGETVVDLWAGYMDVEESRPWESDTIVCVFSITKAIAALCVHVMHDRGLLDLDSPIAAPRAWSFAILRDCYVLMCQTDPSIKTAL